MIDVLIVTAPFSQLKELKEKNYLCFSITGKIYGNYYDKDNIQRIVGLNTFRLAEHTRVKDYFSASYLYKKNLERLGIARIYKEILTKCKSNGYNKVALCGYGKGDEFCYRHLVADFFNNNGILVLERDKVNYSIQKAYWDTDLYQVRGHFNLTDKEVGETLKSFKWIYAKTRPNNPHSYTLRKDMKDNLTFLKIASHIRYFGIFEEFQGILYRIFYYENHKYWTMCCDNENEDVDLINKTDLTL